MPGPLASGDAGQGTRVAGESGKAGQGDPKTSLSPKKQPPSSSVQVRACPGGLRALPMRESSGVPQLGCGQASLWHGGGSRGTDSDEGV